MKITKEKIALIVVRFFLERRGLSYYSINKKTGLDSNTIKAWHLQKCKNIRPGSVDQLISGLQNDISSVFVEFSEFVIEELENEGFMREYTRKIFESMDRDISKIKNQLLELDIPEQKYLQGTIGTINIIEILKSFFSVYRDYFQISENGLGEGETEFIYYPLVYCNKESKNFENMVPTLNYLVLKFPHSYHVGIILSNYVIDYTNSDKFGYYKYMIEKLKNQNGLKMLLFFTDINEETIPFKIQGSLMKEYNLFFEFVNERDLQEISIQGIKSQGKKGVDFLELIAQYRYAQLVFERVMSYLSVISNEIIFLPYWEKLNKNLDQTNLAKVENTLNEIFVSYKERTGTNNYTVYANEILLKDICQYSYLSRHTIYYERNLVLEEVKNFIEKNKKKPYVIEVCAPNSLTTFNICDQCERLLLFTTSHSAYSLMTKLNEKMGNLFLPPNVSLRLCHLNPEYMMHQYPDDLNGKVDFLVIGYGAGSQINDLTRFVRYAYNWLSENGTLFISLYNKEAIVLNKNHINDQRFESSPVYLSDYWTYTLNGHIPLLKKLKAYTPESLKATYLAFFDTEKIKILTYPYISALINPSEYSRAILDEIRKADKDFAPSGVHGQLIDAIVPKKQQAEKLDTEKADMKKADTGIKKYLVKNKIQYDNYTHTLAPDSKSLRRSLQEENVYMSNATLLKTVVLQNKNPKSSTGEYKYYVILPYDRLAVYDSIKYELAPESFVVNEFHQGTVSPLTVFLQKAGNHNFDGKIFLQYKDRINTKKYVIMSGDSNTESIRIKTKDFLKMVQNTNVALQNIIE